MRLKTHLLFKLILPCFLLLLTLTTCITEYVPEGITGSSGILVVDGMVLFPSDTKIKLSRTKDMEDEGAYEVITGAQVSLITENGLVIAYAEELDNTGEYYIKDSLDIIPDTKYAIDIVFGNTHYQSTFEEPFITPEIDDLSWKINNAGDKVEIMATTHDPEQKVNFFLWSYKEDWEFTAQYSVTIWWEPSENALAYRSPTRNIYNCWQKDQSKMLITGSNIDFQDGIIKDKTVVTHFAETSESRFSYLYSILISQYAIPYGAYKYFSNLEKHVTESGSLFAPQPTEMKGNISNLADPDETVVGYVIFSTETNRRLYINGLDIPNMNRPRNCSEMLISQKTIQEASEMGYGYVGTSGNYNLYRPLPCTDCRTNGSKNKPEWWPNDHL